MFWRAQRSRSPPHLTSTIPEMEQHLAAMDTPLQEYPADKADAPATTHGNLPAASLSSQEQTSTTAIDSDDKTVPETTEQQATSFKDDAKTTSTGHSKPKIPRSGTIRVKAQRVRPRLLTLIACASYLLFQLMGIDIGLRTMHGYTEPRLQHAEVELENAAGALGVDYLLDIRLTSLLDTSMGRPYMDTTYEDCLALGLHKANHFYHGLDFASNSHVRNETADWVTSNCRRLLYTPQVYGSRVSMLRARAKHVRHAFDEAFKLLRFRLALLQRRLGGGNLRLAAKSTVTDSDNDTNKRPRVLPDMPYGFGLECEDQTLCRLVYSGSATSTKGREILKIAMADARKQVNRWSWKLGKIHRIVDCVLTPLAILQTLLAFYYLLAFMITLRRPQCAEPEPSCTARQVPTWKRICYTAAQLQHDEKQTVGLIINTALYALLGFQLKYMMSELDRVLLPVGLGLFVFHNVLLAAFIDPSRVGSGDQNLVVACRATKELYLLACCAENVPEWISQQSRSSYVRAKNPFVSSAAKPASMIGARFISPLTPISEDLRQERTAMHAQQGKALADDVELEYGYATETDEEYDADVERSSYVDLTGGTPTVSEDEEDVVLVEG